MRSEAQKQRRREQYAVNAEIERAAMRARYIADPTIWKANAARRAAENPAGERARLKARYAANRSVEQGKRRANYAANKAAYKARAKARKPVVKQRTPPWADLDAIRAIYEKAARIAELTGEPVHVDHDIPLRGKLVSGLHVHTNLVIRHATENLRKSNHFEVA